jgi:hypothetical protein
MKNPCPLRVFVQVIPDVRLAHLNPPTAVSLP